MEVIVRGTATSPRLTGRISSPIEIEPIDSNDIGELISTRLKHYVEVDDAKAPVNEFQFEYLFNLSHFNLRDSLKYAQDFSVWLAENDLLDEPQNEFFGYMEGWLKKRKRLLRRSGCSPDNGLSSINLLLVEAAARLLMQTLTVSTRTSISEA